MKSKKELYKEWKSQHIQSKEEQYKEYKARCEPHNDATLLVSLILIATAIYILLFVGPIGQFTNKNKIELSESIITKQQALEEEFEVDKYTLDNPNVILNPYGNSPLTALVLFQTEEEVTPNITIKGKDELSTYEGVGKPATDHYVPIYGLYAGQENEVIIDIGETKKTLLIKTDPLPENIAIPVDVKADKSKLTNELYFFTPSSVGYTSAYDVNGDIRWYLTDNMAWDISRLANGRLLLSTERPINPPYFTTGLYEVDLLGKVYNEYSLPGGYHHDFFEMDNGNLLIASDDFDNEHGTVEDYIVEIDRSTGEIVKSWDLKDILNMEDGKSENWTNYDWFHNNSVWYDNKENIIVLSGRHQDVVIAIDYDTSESQWIIGDPGGWSEEYQDYFFTPIGNLEWQWSQHAAMVTPEGYVFILDNGNNKSKIKEEYVKAEDSYTRGVMYEINTENMTIKQIWEYGKERGYEFYSPYISDVDYLNEEHYLVHSGGIVYVDGKISNRPAGFDTNVDLYSTTVEILNDEVVYELTLPTNMYRSEKMSLYNHSQFELGEQRKLGGLGMTEPTNEYYSFIRNPFKVHMPDDEYKSHNINFINEEDRLVLNGTFDKYEKVSLMLAKDYKIKEYEIRVSKKPYTALCIDLFTQEETDNTLEINKYINKEGLKGIHAIYIKIGDKLYNARTTINFSK